MKKLLLTLCLAALAIQMNADALSTQILQNNESLQAARLSLAGDELTLQTEGNLPDPEVEVEIMASPVSSIELTATESLEWPGVYKMRGNARRHRIDAMHYLYESKKMEVLKQARLAYADLVSLNNKLQRRRQLLTVVDSILKSISKADLRQGFTVLDVSKLKIETFDIASDISAMEIQREVVLSDLVQMNGGKPLEGVDLNCASYQLSVMPADHYVAAYYDSPEYQAVLSGLQADAYDIKASKQSWLPNITFGYKFVKDGDVRGHGAVVGLSIPMFSNRGKVKASQAVQTSNDYAKSALSRKGEADIRSRYDEVVRLQQSIADYRARLNYAEVKRYLDQALATKSITIVDYLAEYQYILNAFQKLDDMQADLASKYIELSKYESVE